MTPYYDEDGITIYHGDCREVLPYSEWPSYAVLLTDPPFGIDYESDKFGTLLRSISGDKDTSLRDFVLSRWQEWRPAFVFGSWRVPRPAGTRALLVWDTGGALGMGDLSLPWKPSHQEIYVLGDNGFSGPRDSDVLHFPPVQSLARNGRTHPHEKPVALLAALLQKCPDRDVFDPFMGTGSSLIAAKSLGRRAIGIEIEERYCEIAAQRLSQQTLGLGAA